MWWDMMAEAVRASHIMVVFLDVTDSFCCRTERPKQDDNSVHLKSVAVTRSDTANATGSECRNGREWSDVAACDMDGKISVNEKQFKTYYQKEK